MKPALLVIDVQNEYFAPHGQWVLPDGEKALPHIQALLAAARDAQIPIVHITHEELDPGSSIFRAGSIAVDMHPAIEVRPEEKLIKKHFPGSFTQTPLEAYLRQHNVDTVIISGFMTQMCCDTTTRQADERGLATLFASDATAARDLTLNGQTVSHRIIHETTLAVMTQFATVLSAEDIIKKLENK
ncbi:MAG TPA: cysteine hydrolase family protein [Ktedonobacteraceae bacterium]|nr:cysteine hydrolase family protein [Ktedonobacteraceae bacterium]